MIRDLAASAAGTVFASLVVAAPVTVRLKRDTISLRIWRPLRDRQTEALQAVAMFICTGKDLPPDLEAVAKRRLGRAISAVALAVSLGISLLLWRLS